MEKEESSKVTFDNPSSKQEVFSRTPRRNFLRPLRTPSTILLVRLGTELSQT
jgi:hypothetical protein